MEKLIYLFVFLGLAVHFTACTKDIDKFDNGTNYIYFDVPFVQDQFGRNTEQRQDSITHSFALDGADARTYTFRIAVNVLGLATDYDRSYHVEVVRDSSNVTNEDWTPAVIETLVIRKGTLSDTLDITVQKTDFIENNWRRLTLALIPNEHFQAGVTDLQTVKICFTNIIAPPSWWKAWQPYFGDFCREKFDKWREIYYLGADPNVEQNGPNTGKQWYWDNMPYYISTGNSTKTFIQVLKNYFIQNEVYPGGDRTKPRITLP